MATGDEPKTIRTDFCDGAVASNGQNPSFDKFIDANVNFFSNLNAHIKNSNKEISIALFLYDHFDDKVVNRMAVISDLDYDGCDGRPWAVEDGGQLEEKGKILLGCGEHFLAVAHNNNKQSLWLIENHNMTDNDADKLKKRMREVIAKEIERLIYYYYPRNVQSPDKICRCWIMN